MAEQSDNVHVHANVNTINWDDVPTRPEIRLPMRRQRERDEELRDTLRQRRETVPHVYERGTIAR